MFINYNENITIQYKIWAFDRRNIIKYYKILFLKHKNWKSDFLNFFTITINTLFKRRFVKISRKIVFTFAIVFAVFIFAIFLIFIVFEFVIFEIRNEIQSKVKSAHVKKTMNSTIFQTKMTKSINLLRNQRFKRESN